MHKSLMRTYGIAFSIAAGLLFLSAGITCADVRRSAGTTAVVGEGGELVIENSLGLENDKDGTAWTLDMAILYTPEILSRFSLLLEPTLWEWDRPRDGEAVNGFGDVDLSLFYLLFLGSDVLPGVVVGTKVKIPTASNDDIGTGKADFSALLIVGKEFGELDINLELEYATFGQPDSSSSGDDVLVEEDEGADADFLTESSEKLKDQFIYTLSVDYGLTENLTPYVELFGNTKPTKDESSSFAAGFGLEYDFELTDATSFIVEAGIDTDELITGKIGFEWTF